MEKLLLPKGYLSYSQMNFWKWSQEKYKETYFEGKPYPTNPIMDFGKDFSEIMDGKKETDDIVIQGVVSLMPKYDTSEKEIRESIEGIELLGYIDSYCSKTHSIYEYKTGMTPWTQDKVDEADQLTFYSMLVYLRHKVIPEKISLIWAETTIEDDLIQFTGNVKRFETSRELADVLKMLARTKKVAREISEAYKEYLGITKQKVGNIKN